jgi:microcystin-dependent protein
LAVLSTVANVATPGLPVGSIQAFAGANAPAGWLLCDGSAVTRGNYPDLYNTIGNTYGSGDGSTTFNLPDLRGRMPMGAGTGLGLNASGSGTTSGTAMTARTRGQWGGEETHLLTGAESGVAAHNHGITDPGHNHSLNESPYTGAGNSIAVGANPSAYINNSQTNNATTGITVNNATAANAASRHSVVSPFLVTNYIIKAVADIARGGWYTQSSPPVVTQLPTNPAIGEEVYYLFTGTNNLGNICHIRWNGTRWTIISPTTLVRWNCGSASQVISTTSVVNITTGDYGTVSFTPPWDGWYEFGINLRNVQLTSGIGISVYLSNANFSANYEVAYFEDVNGNVYHTKIPITGPRVDYLYASNTYRWASSITYAVGNTGTLFTSGVAYVKAVG